MTLAYNYPILNLIWTMFMFFVFVLWIWLLITVFMDIFRSHDLGGWAKALWVLFIIILPFLGVLVYLIARGGKMHERAARAGGPAAEGLRRLRQADRRLGQQADDLAKLADLKAAGRDHRRRVRGPEGQDPRLTSSRSDGPVAAPVPGARRAATAASGAPSGPRSAPRVAGTVSA